MKFHINGNFCSWAILIGTALFLSAYIYLEFFNAPYYYRQSEVHVVGDGPFYPGDTVFIERTYCVNVRFSRIDTYLYDNHGRVYSNVSREFVDSHPPCPTTQSYPVLIPDFKDIDEVHYHGTHTIVQNILRTDIVGTPEVTIKVSKRP